MILFPFLGKELVDPGKSGILEIEKNSIPGKQNSRQLKEMLPGNFFGKKSILVSGFPGREFPGAVSTRYIIPMDCNLI